MKKALILVVIGIIFGSFSLLAQRNPDDKRDFRKLHYLSEEEMLTPLKRDPNFTETDPPVGPVKMVGEFESMQAVLIRYPLGIPYTVIAEMAQDLNVITIVSSNSQATQVLALYNSNGINTANCTFLVAPTDSYWTRDYGPWFVFDGNNQPGVCDFPYDRPRPTDDNIPVKVAQSLGINLFGMALTHTGGNMMADGFDFAASTDLVLDENTDMTEQEVHDKMEAYLGLTQYDITLDPLGDYIKHIDCWGKYLAPDKILIGRVPLNDDRYADYEAVATYFATTNCPYGYPYKVYRVFTPGTAPNTPYSNSIILNNKVLVPLTGSQWDDEAIAVYQEAMPGYEVIGMQWTGWLNTDALHCRAIGIANLDMLFLDHRPLFGQVGWQDSLAVAVKIVPYSGENLVEDSLLIQYQVNSGSYQNTVLRHSEGSNYVGYIKNYAEFDTIRYFISGLDAADNRAKLPYMGAADPFNFVVGEHVFTDLTITPDSLIFTYEYLDQVIIKNNTANEATIGSIQATQGYIGFPTLPNLPYVIQAGDSLIVDVEIGIITFNPVFIWLYDSISIVSNISTQQVYVKVNSDLIGSVCCTEHAPLRVYPNPFSTELVFQLPNLKSAYTELKIYNVVGNLIHTSQEFAKGHIRWDGTSISKYIVPNGIYYYQLFIDNELFTGNIIKLK